MDCDLNRTDLVDAASLSEIEIQFRDIPWKDECSKFRSSNCLGQLKMSKNGTKKLAWIPFSPFWLLLLPWVLHAHRSLLTSGYPQALFELHFLDGSFQIRLVFVVTLLQFFVLLCGIYHHSNDCLMSVFLERCIFLKDKILTHGCTPSSNTESDTQ